MEENDAMNNPESIAQPMGTLAAELANKFNADAAAVLIIKEGKIGLYMGGKKEPSKEFVSETFSKLGSHLLKMAVDVFTGKAKPLLIDEDGIEMQVELPEQKPKLPRKSTPWDGFKWGEN